MIHHTSYNELIAPYIEAPPAATILDINFGFARARVLDTAIELRLFTYIAEGIDTCSALAVAAGCNGPSLQRLLDALTGLELLQCKQAVYELTPQARTYLVEGQPGYLGSHLKAVMEQWDTWSKLTETIQSGHKHIRRDWGSPQGRGDDPGMFAHVFPLGFPLAWQVACGLAPQVDQFEQPLQGRVLDMFAGSGSWGIAMALRHPQVTVVARDEPGLLQSVHAAVQQFGLEKRFELRSTEEDERLLGSEQYSLIIIAHACRFLGSRKSQELLKTGYRLLKPGGKLLLMDVIPNDERTGPPVALMIQLSLLLNTQGGDIFTAAQFRTWLQAAGFEDVKDLRIGHIPLLLASR
jgi:ubiquinone/menaquinone biosynthesis C-methylase UbiE